MLCRNQAKKKKELQQTVVALKQSKDRTEKMWIKTKKKNQIRKEEGEVTTKTELKLIDDYREKL